MDYLDEMLIECIDLNTCVSPLSRSTKSSLEELRSACSSGLEKWVARLRSESASLKAETKANEEVGRGVTVKVMQSAAPNECDKYKLHVEETDKITSLLLGLTARMARMENSIAASAATASQDQKVRNIESILTFSCTVVRQASIDATF